MFYVGFYHFLIYRRQKDNRENLTFSLSCFSVGLYAVFCAGLYNASSPEVGVEWQRLQVITLDVLAVVLLWFIADYTGHTNRKIVMGFTVYYALAALAGLLIRSDLTWTSVASIKEIRLPFGYDIIYNEMKPGVLNDINSIMGLIYFIYILTVSLKFYRSGYKEKGMPLLAAMIILFAGLMNDTLMSSGIYDFIYILEYSYIGIILVFTFVLTNNVIKAGEIKIALHKSEERYRLIAENVADVIWTTDMNYRFTYISPSVYQQRGFTIAEAMEQSLDEVVLPDSFEKIMNLYGKKLVLIEAGDPEGWKPAIFETEQYCKDGTTIWSSNNARILPGPDKQPISILGITRDISDLKRSQEIMVQSEKMMSVGGLAAGMAHEINNPLAGMMQSAEVISMRLGGDMNLTANLKAAEEAGTTMEAIKSFMAARSIPRMIDAINESGRRVAEIVDNMLSFARKSDARVSSHNLTELMDKTLKLAATDYDLKKQYDFKNIEIIKEYEDNLPMVPCEGAKIQQVLLNILRNGSQAMQGNSGRIVDYKPKFILRLLKETGTNMLRIEIEDNGPGMDEATRKRIFEPFFTTKPAGVGTGLGLSVSYFIITENHGGTMDVISEPGKGATFIICLPLENNE
jgi:PAS domain S-box-containing protein